MMKERKRKSSTDFLRRVCVTIIRIISLKCCFFILERKSKKKRLLKNADKQVSSRDIESSQTKFSFIFISLFFFSAVLPLASV